MILHGTLIQSTIYEKLRLTSIRLLLRNELTHLVKVFFWIDSLSSCKARIRPKHKVMDCNKNMSNTSVIFKFTLFKVIGICRFFFLIEVMWIVPATHDDGGLLRYEFLDYAELWTREILLSVTVKLMELISCESSWLMTQNLWAITERNGCSIKWSLMARTQIWIDKSCTSLVAHSSELRNVKN